MTDDYKVISLDGDDADVEPVVKTLISELHSKIKDSEVFEDSAIFAMFLKPHGNIVGGRVSGLNIPPSNLTILSAMAGVFCESIVAVSKQYGLDAAEVYKHSVFSAIHDKVSAHNEEVVRALYGEKVHNTCMDISEHMYKVAKSLNSELEKQYISFFIIAFAKVKNTTRIVRITLTNMVPPAAESFLLLSTPLVPLMCTKLTEANVAAYLIFKYLEQAGMTEEDAKREVMKLISKKDEEESKEVV